LEVVRHVIRLVSNEYTGHKSRSRVAFGPRYRTLL